MMAEIFKLYILMSLWVALIFIQGHSCIRIKNLYVHLSVDLDEIYVATTCLLKLMLNSFAQVIFKGEYSAE